MEGRITETEALEVATKIYQRLMRQGRDEASARRDAEHWVVGNYGLSVKLPEPKVEPPRVNVENFVVITIEDTNSSFWLNLIRW